MDSDIRSTKNESNQIMRLRSERMRNNQSRAKENIFWPMFYNLKTVAEVIVNRARTPNQFPDK